jgi:hypothetical protein
MRILPRYATAALILITLAACGTNGAGAGAGPSPTAMSNAEVLALGKQVAQCFRDNGIPEFPDPIVDDHGQLQLPNNMEAQIEELYPQQALEQAQQACQSLFDQLPESAIRGEGESTDPDAPGPEDVDALRRWAACARENGIPEWPDPKADGSFPLAGTALGAEGKSERMRRVFEACQQYWSGGITYS